MVATRRVGWRFGTDVGEGVQRYHQHDQRRPVLRLCQGRQDPAHHADRLRRTTTRSPGPSKRAAGASRRRARPRSRCTAWRGNRSSTRQTGCSTRCAASTSIRSGERHPGEPRQVGLRAHQLGRSARSRRERNRAASRWSTAPARSPSTIPRITPGATSATGPPRCSASSTRSATPASITIPTAGKAGTGAPQHHWGNTMRLGLAEPYGTVERPAEGSRAGRVLVERPGIHQRHLRGLRRNGAAHLAEGARHPDGAHRAVPQRHGRVHAAASGSRRGRAPTPRSRSRSRRSGSPKACTTRSSSPSARSASTSGSATSSARTTAYRRRPSGSRPRPAFPRAKCARSRASGAASAPTSPPAAWATAGAARAAARPGTSGRAPWCASPRCRAWDGRA